MHGALTALCASHRLRGMQAETINVRQIRTEILKESQTAFAERFGVDQSTVARWEIEGLPSRGTAKKAVEKFVADLEGAA